MAEGYDIGVSASSAFSTSTPLAEQAGTVFNFASPGASGDWYGDQSQTANPQATAVSTDKSPGATSTVIPTLGGGSTGGLSLSTVAIIAAALLGGLGIIGYAIYSHK